MRDIQICSYIALFVSILLGTVEHVIFNLYPISPASKAIDDAFGVIIALLLAWTAIVHAVAEYKKLIEKRNQSKLK